MILSALLIGTLVTAATEPPPPPPDAPVVAPTPTPKQTPAPSLSPSTTPEVRDVPYDGGPVPPGAYVVTEYNPALLGFGYVALIGAYSVAAGTGVILGLFSIFGGRWEPFWALIPIVGPFLALSAPSDSSVGSSLAHSANALFVLCGIGQIAGTGMLVAGGLFPTKKLRYLPPEQDEKVSLTFHPIVGPVTGMGLTLRFP